MHDLIEKNSSRLDLLMRSVDVLALFAAGQFAASLRFSGSLNDAAPVHTVLLYFCCFLAFALFAQCDLYASWRGRSLRLMLGQVTLAILCVLAAGLVFGFLIRQINDLSRLWVLYWGGLSLAALILMRALLYSVLSQLRKHGFNHKHVIIVGYGETGRELHKRALQQQWTGYQVKAIHDPVKPDNGIDHLQELADIPAAVVRHAVHEVWLTMPLSESGKLQALQTLLGNMLIDIRWVPDASTIAVLSNKTVEFLGMPVIDLNRPASFGLLGLAKDLFDKLFAVCALILLAPLFLVLAICIKLSSPGPVFFLQPRLGLNGKRFNVLKFRSMKSHHTTNGIVTQATRDDPRVTPVGRFMRRTSLDELPQFINVLKGEMSVVGPRPHALAHNDLYKNKLAMYMQRHRVKPGITGWAQIHGYRGETDTDDKMAQRVAFDLHYIQHWSFWMDLRIIIWTAFKGWTDTNAY